MGGVVLGILFKLIHWTGASLLVVAFGCGLALYYFPFGLRTLAVPGASPRIAWLNLLAGGALGVAMVGLVGRMHLWGIWPAMLTLGTLLCLGVLPVAAYLRHRQQGRDLHLDGIMLRCLVLGALALGMQAFNGQALPF